MSQKKKIQKKNRKKVRKERERLKKLKQNDTPKKDTIN